MPTERHRDRCLMHLHANSWLRLCSPCNWHQVLGALRRTQHKPLSWKLKRSNLTVSHLAVNGLLRLTFFHKMEYSVVFRLGRNEKALGGDSTIKAEWTFWIRHSLVHPLVYSYENLSVAVSLQFCVPWIPLGKAVHCLSNFVFHFIVNPPSHSLSKPTHQSALWVLNPTFCLCSALSLRNCWQAGGSLIPPSLNHLCCVSSSPGPNYGLTIIAFCRSFDSLPSKSGYGSIDK